MRIQIVMSLVGRLLYIFGIFTLIPFIYSVVFETAYWSFLITTSLSLVLGTLWVLSCILYLDIHGYFGGFTFFGEWHID